MAERWRLVGLRSPRRLARMGAGAPPPPLHPAAHFHASYREFFSSGLWALCQIGQKVARRL